MEGAEAIGVDDSGITLEQITTTENLHVNTATLNRMAKEFLRRVSMQRPMSSDELLKYLHGYGVRVGNLRYDMFMHQICTCTAWGTWFVRHARSVEERHTGVRPRGAPR